jgi:hypothetical protein
MTPSDEELDRFAELVASKILGRIKPLLAPHPSDEYVRGTVAIARFLGVSPETYRRRHAKKVPVCGYEEYRHLGKITMRPICRTSDLRAYRENLPKKLSARC